MFDYNDFPTRNIYDGTQSTIQFGELELSVVQHSGSYGGKEGLYEIAVFGKSNSIELPGITEDGDTVRGYLTKDDVDCIISKMFLITKCEPVSNV